MPLMASLLRLLTGLSRHARPGGGFAKRSEKAVSLTERRSAEGASDSSMSLNIRIAVGIEKTAGRPRRDPPTCVGRRGR